MQVEPKEEAVASRSEPIETGAHRLAHPVEHTVGSTSERASPGSSTSGPTKRVETSKVASKVLVSDACLPRVGATRTQARRNSCGTRVGTGSGSGSPGQANTREPVILRLAFRLEARSPTQDEGGMQEGTRHTSSSEPAPDPEPGGTGAAAQVDTTADLIAGWLGGAGQSLPLGWNWTSPLTLCRRAHSRSLGREPIRGESRSHSPCCREAS